MADTTGKRSARKDGKSVAKANAIQDHLCQADPKLAKMIARVGAFALTINEMQSSYQALAESIVYQQITGKAAQSICNKVMANFKTTSFPGPKLILAASLEDLRACGLSRGKAMALQDLALKTLEGLVPEVDEMHNLSDQELHDRLTAVRGIGPWTVQMLMMFRLGRMDILPATDYGVRKGFALTFYGKARAQSEDLPKPAEITARAERWRPFRTAASWYLWRCLDLDKEPVTIKKTEKITSSEKIKITATPKTVIEKKSVKKTTAKKKITSTLLSLLTTFSAATSYLTLSTTAAQAQRQQDYGPDDTDDDDPPPRRAAKIPPKLSVPAFITYWSHDALGYHPSMALTIENVSDTSLLGEQIQLQAHFRLVSEGILTVYRWQTRLDTIGGKQQINTIAHSKRPFELPLDPAEWPMIECKIICKIGDASSEETQNLIVARVEPVAMSDEEAHGQLNSQLGRNRLAKAKAEQGKKAFDAAHAAARKTEAVKPVGRPASSLPSTPTAPKARPVAQMAQQLSLGNSERPVEKAPERPLTAVANSLGGSFYVGSNTSEQFLTKGSLPGLGDDFYMFEKALGMPVQTDAKDKNWIWASYKKHPQVRLIAGSKGRTGKADVVVCAIDQENKISDAQFINYARAISGKFKAEKPSATEHSVRYTGDGRVELVNMSAQSLRAIYFTTTDADGHKVAVVAVSRLPGSISELLKDIGSRSDLLRFTLRGLGESDSGADSNAPAPRGVRPNSNDDDDQ